MWSSSSTHVLQDSCVDLFVRVEESEFGWSPPPHLPRPLRWWVRERGNYCIQVHLSFFQHKIPATICSPGDYFSQLILTPELDPELLHWMSFEVNLQQTYRGSSFNVGWMRGTMLVYTNSLFPSGLLINQFPWMTQLGEFNEVTAVSIPCSSTSSIQVPQFQSVVADIYIYVRVIYHSSLLYRIGHVIFFVISTAVTCNNFLHFRWIWTSLRPNNVGGERQWPLWKLTILADGVVIHHSKDSPFLNQKFSEEEGVEHCRKHGSSSEAVGHTHHVEA